MKHTALGLLMLFNGTTLTALDVQNSSIKAQTVYKAFIKYTTIDENNLYYGVGFHAVFSIQKKDNDTIMKMETLEPIKNYNRDIDFLRSHALSVLAGIMHLSIKDLKKVVDRQTVLPVEKFGINTLPSHWNQNTIKILNP